MAEDNIQQAARELGRILRDDAMNNPAYQELGQHTVLQELSDIIESGAQKNEAVGITIPATPRVEAELDTRARDPVFNRSILLRVYQYPMRHSITNALHTLMPPPPITEAPSQRVGATLPSKAREVKGVLIGRKRNSVKNAS